MNTDAVSVGDTFDTFCPTINKHSRRLVSGSFSVAERQQHDIERREKRRQDLLLKVQMERQRTETFVPVINRYGRWSGSSTNVDTTVSNSGRGSALITSSQQEHSEETFRPAINAKSRRIVAGCLLQGAQQHSQEVRQRVQALWRTHAGIGSGEMTLNGVYAVFKELGLQVPSAIADKFLLALGMNEGTGVRCVRYDRFMKVFVVVLSAALIPPSADKSSGAGDSRLKKGHGACDNALMLESAQNQQGPTPTMRRSSRSLSAASREKPEGAEGESMDTHGRRGKVLLASEVLLGDSMEPDVEDYDIGCKKKDCSSSPSFFAFSSASSSQLRSSVGNVRKSAGSHGPSRGSTTNDPRVAENKVRRATYDPLAECTFAPTINKRVLNSRFSSSADGEKQAMMPFPLSNRRKAPVAPPKSRAESEIEECTFAPNTACFHKDRASLAWWTQGAPSGTAAGAKAASTRNPSNTSSFVEPGVTCSNGGGNERGDVEERRATAAEEGEGGASSHKKKPHQNPRLARRASQIPIAPGFDKAVQRMTEARKKNRPVFEEMLRTCSEESHKPLRPTVVEPFLLRSVARQQSRDQRRPLLYVDIDLPSGKTGRIGICKGDRAADLARSFSNAYGLSDELKKLLENILSDKLNEFFGENESRLWL